MEPIANRDATARKHHEIEPAEDEGPPADREVRIDEPVDQQRRPPGEQRQANETQPDVGAREQKTKRPHDGPSVTAASPTVALAPASRILMIRAGTPPTTAIGGTSRVTT